MKRNISTYKCFARLFSRSAMHQLIEKDDVTYVNNAIIADELFSADSKSYKDFISYAYQQLIREYRNEYLYKNTLINSLLNELIHKDTVVINEFRVGTSIVDLAVFNGTSRAYEIKTELDSPARLEKQLSDYSKVFREVYLVTYQTLVPNYRKLLPKHIGIYALIESKSGELKVKLIRKAQRSYNRMDTDMVMTTLRRYEYIQLVKEYFGCLPKVSSLKLYESCREWLREIPATKLNKVHKIYLETLKKRKNNNHLLEEVTPELRQLCISLQWNQDTINRINRKLKTNITLN